MNFEGFDFDFHFDEDEEDDSGVEIDWAGVEDISEDTYEEPEHEMLECPSCHHVDRKIHFKKV